MVKEIPSTLKDVRGNKSKWPLFDIVFSRKKTHTEKKKLTNDDRRIGRVEESPQNAGEQDRPLYQAVRVRYERDGVRESGRQRQGTDVEGKSRHST
jgi:hypothetical protein